MDKIEYRLNLGDISIIIRDVAKWGYGGVTLPPLTQNISQISEIVPESQNRATAENEAIKIVFVSDVI